MLLLLLLLPLLPPPLLLLTWQDEADAIVAAAEQAKRGQVVGMDIGMRWNPALHELRRVAVVEKDLGQLTGARLTLAFKQWPREWQVALRPVCQRLHALVLLVCGR